MKLQKKLSSALLVAACALAGVAAAQTIAVPASSTDSGSRATVGIAPVDLTGLQNQINSVAGTANSAYWYGTTAYNTANYAVSVASSGWTTGKVVASGTGVSCFNGGCQQVPGVCVVGAANQAQGVYIMSSNCPGGTGFVGTFLPSWTPP